MCLFGRGIYDDKVAGRADVVSHEGFDLLQHMVTLM